MESGVSRVLITAVVLLMSGGITAGTGGFGSGCEPSSLLGSFTTQVLSPHTTATSSSTTVPTYSEVETLPSTSYATILPGPYPTSSLRLDSSTRKPTITPFPSCPSRPSITTTDRTSSSAGSTVVPTPSSRIEVTERTTSIVPSPSPEVPPVAVTLIGISASPSPTTTTVPAVAACPSPPTTTVPAVAASPSPPTTTVPAVAASPSPPTTTVPAVAATPSPTTTTVPAVAASPSPTTTTVPAIAASPSPPTTTVPAVAASPSPPTTTVPAVAASPSPPTTTVPAVAASPSPPTTTVPAVAASPSPTTTTVPVVAASPSPPTTTVPAVAASPSPSPPPSLPVTVVTLYLMEPITIASDEVDDVLANITESLADTLEVSVANIVNVTLLQTRVRRQADSVSYNTVQFSLLAREPQDLVKQLEDYFASGRTLRISSSKKVGVTRVSSTVEATPPPPLTTQAPTTQAPTTQPPTTQAPTTQPPTTQAPTTQVPTPATTVPAVAASPSPTTTTVPAVAASPSPSPPPSLPVTVVTLYLMEPITIASDEVDDVLANITESLADTLEVSVTNIVNVTLLQTRVRRQADSVSYNTVQFSLLAREPQDLVKQLKDYFASGRTLRISSSKKVGVTRVSSTVEATLPPPLTTQPPTTQAPTTQAPTTQAPTTQAPTTQGPTTQGPTTQGPTTQAPTTQGPTTQAPTPAMPGLSTGHLAGIILGAAAAALCLLSSVIALCCYCERRRRTGSHEFKTAPDKSKLELGTMRNSPPI